MKNPTMEHTVPSFIRVDREVFDLDNQRVGKILGVAWSFGTISLDLDAGWTLDGEISDFSPVINTQDPNQPLAVRYWHSL